MKLYNITEEDVNRTFLSTAEIDRHKQNQTENEIVINLPSSDDIEQLKAQEGSNEDLEAQQGSMPLSSTPQPLTTNSYPETTTDKYERWHAKFVKNHNKTHTHIAHIRSQINVCASTIAERDAQIKDLTEGIDILKKEKEEKEEEIKNANATIEFCSSRIVEIDKELGDEETNTTTVPTLERPVRDLQKQEKKAELGSCKTAEVDHLKKERTRLIIEKREAQALARKKREEVTEYKEKIKKWKGKHKKAVEKRKKADNLLRNLEDMNDKMHDSAADAAAHANATISTNTTTSTNKHARRSVAYTNLNDKNEGGNMGTMNYTAVRNQIEELSATIVKKLRFNKASKTPCSNGNDKDDLSATLDHMRKSNLSHGITSNESSTSHPIPNGLDYPITMQTLSAICSGVIGIAHANATDNSTESNNKENTNWYHVVIAAAGIGIGVVIQPVVVYARNKLQKKAAHIDNHDNQESICLVQGPSDHSQLFQDVSSFGDTGHGPQTTSNQPGILSDVFVDASSVIQKAC